VRLRKVVLFGAGYWGVNYLKELGQHCVAVVDPQQESKTWIQQMYGVPVYPELPSDLDFDSAIVVTPPDTHVLIALPLLEQGKYVLIEKPVAHSTKEVEKLMPYADKCMSAFIYLYHQGIRELHHELFYTTDKIDHVFMRRTNDGPRREWGNVLWDLAPHDVAISISAFGEVTDVHAAIAKNHAFLFLKHESVETTIYVSWMGGPKTRQIEVAWSDRPERTIFDDMKTTYVITPLREMLTTFLSGKWDERGSVTLAWHVTKVLEEACQ
jgi:predicted dehydrogenase